MKVGFIGLGAMGRPMAENLSRAGFSVVGFDVSADARAAFADCGGAVGATAGQAVRAAAAVVTMLPNGKIVRDVLRAHEVLDALAPDALVIEMSSSAPADTRDLATALSARGIRLVDAPVSGGVKRAVAATLAIMVGGADDDVDAALPVLKALGRDVYRTGAVGSGHAMKAINNFVSGAGVIAAMEAVLLGRAFGIDAETLVDVLNASSGRNNATEVKMKQFVLSGSFGSGFALGLMAKDIRIAADLAAALGLDLAALAATADRWDAARLALGPTVDHTEIMRFLSDRG